MPRKSRDKEVQSPRQVKKVAGTTAEPMPQVWLPDQPEGDNYPSFLPPTRDTPTTPTDEEQQQMAQMWAEEEHQGPQGWDEDQELDYSEVVRKREEREMSEPRETVDMPDLFRYAQSSTFMVRSLGHLTNIPTTITPATTSADTQTITLHTIDKAQKQGLLPWVTSEAERRVFCISKYGIKVTDVKKQRVFTRHALHYIINITYYEDTYSKHMLAVRVMVSSKNKQLQPQQQQELYIYEAENEAQAKDICLTLAQAFETVHKNLQLQQNLTSDLR